MTTTRHFMEEFFKLAFEIKAPPVLSSAFGKNTKGVVAMPQTLSTASPVKIPAVKGMKGLGMSTPSMGGKIKGVAGPSKTPPAISGGTNVR